MHKIKGLLTAIKGNQQTSSMILPYNKRIEEYLKIMKRINQVYDKIFIQPFAYFNLQLSNLNKSAFNQVKAMKNKPQIYSFMIDIFIQSEKILKSTNNQIRSYSNEGFNAIVEECHQIKKVCDILQQKLDIHETKEKDLLQNIKKYSKSHKNFLQSVEAYKLAFQDVKLIYNIEQKTKRYKVCSSYFGSAVSQLEQINENIKFLTDERVELKKFLQRFRTKSCQFIRIVGQQVIKIPQNIIKCLLKSNKQLFKLLTQKIKIFKQKSARNIFEKFRLPFPNPQYFDCELKQLQNALYPSFLINLKSLKTQHFGKCKKFIIEYYISTRQDIKERLELNQKMKNYFGGLNTLFQKFFVSQQRQVKQIISEKYIKLIESNLQQSLLKQNAQQTNAQNKNSIKIMNSLKISQTIQAMIIFLDEQRQLTKNMTKFYSQQTKQIQLQLQQENKNLMMFKDQFKNRFYSLFDGKKQFKKDIENLKSGEIQALFLVDGQVKQIREDILKKTQFILLLINGFAQKFKISSTKIKNYFQTFLDDFNKHIGYQKQLYQKYKHKLQEYTYIFVQKRLQQPEDQKDRNLWVDENSLYKAIIQENLKIQFNSQIQKVNQFKKLKKPTQSFDETTCSSPRSNISPVKKQSSDSFILPFSKNYEQFIQQNTIFQQGQKYVANFTCGLCDNIIVSGRLYITTHRLFFHSRFNSSNIFFGYTKLEIPRIDIKKIEKKYNAIIFDNSISITTVNGQIFLTSFGSRDKTYDLICKTFQINLDESVFILEEQIVEALQNQQDKNNFHLNVQQQDDLQENQLQNRSKLIDQMIEKDENSDQKAQLVPYQNVLKSEITFPGLNAAKVFKIFESGQQMPYKNKSYESFWHYFKGHVHKNQDMIYDQWQPNILDFLNPSNIKKNTPLKFKRRTQTNVPAPDTNIPFMPKFIESIQDHQLYFYSKDKYVVIVKVKNSKAPYTDCFYLRYKKIVETKSENTVKVESNLKIIFIKKTMVQGMIQSKTLKSSTDNSESMADEMRKYLKYLQNSLMKKNAKKSDKSKDISTTDGQIIEEQQKEFTQNEVILSENIKLKNNLKSSNLKNQIFKWGLLISVLLNIVLILIIMFGNGQNQQVPKIQEIIPSEQNL